MKKFLGKINSVSQMYKSANDLYKVSFHKRQRVILQLPMVLVMLYLAVTLFIYAFGPFAWVTHSPVKFWGLQVCYLTMLWMGFQLGIRRTEKNNIEWSQEDDAKILRLFPVLLTINLVYTVVNLFRSYGYATMDFEGLISNLVYGLQNMGAGYSVHQGLTDSLQGNQVLGGYVVTALNYLWNFAAFAVVLLGILYFPKLGWGSRILAIANYTIIIINFVAIGTNIGVFRIVLAVVLFVAVAYLAQIFRKFDGKQKKMLILVVGLALVGVAVVVVYFVKIMKSRGGILNWDSASYNVGGIGLNRDSIFFAILPESLYIPMISISSYLTQGYYGLSLCMSLPWIPTFGLGTSLQIVDLISDHFFDIRSSTYQFRAMEFGWDDRINWHSMYSWFANDVGFYGVIAVMFVIGFVFALVYKDSITTRNPFARVLVFYFALMFVFIPCNNQIIQTTYTLFPLITIFACWIASRSVRMRRFLNNLKLPHIGRKK